MNSGLPQSTDFEARVDENFFSTFTLQHSVEDALALVLDDGADEAESLGIILGERPTERERLGDGGVKGRARAFAGALVSRPSLFSDAVDVIKSRVFAFPIGRSGGEQGKLRVVAPLFDFCNHGGAGAVSRLSFEAGRARLRLCVGAHQKGEQVLLRPPPPLRALAFRTFVHFRSLSNLPQLSRPLSPSLSTFCMYFYHISLCALSCVSLTHSLSSLSLSLPLSLSL